VDIQYTVHVYVALQGLFPVTQLPPLPLQSPQSGGKAWSGSQPLHQEMLLPHSTAAEAHWCVWGGGEFVQRNKDKKGRGI
jgi:hypothetical protein